MPLPFFLKRRSFFAATLACAAVITPYTWALSPAPDWPTKPLRIVVGFPGGSSPDLAARTFAQPLSQLLGQPVIVENKVGAVGNIGAAEVARAKDNHTIGLMINNNLTIAKILNPAAPYDPLKDLAPLSLIGVSPLVLTAPSSTRLSGTNSSGQAFFEEARKAADHWSYGTPGIGTMGHLGTELLKARSGINPVHIPYSGYPQVAAAMVSGQLQMALLPPALALTQAQAGNLRLIGVTSTERSTLVPDVPTLSEAGIEDFDLQIWNAFAAPNTMPAPIRAKLATMLAEIAQDKMVQQQLRQQGWQAIGSSPEVLAQRIQKDTQVLLKLIETQNISAQ